MRRTEIAVERLSGYQRQVRENAWIGDELDQRLASSIETTGLLHDIVVRETDSLLNIQGRDPDYEIIAGTRRYQAALQAGYEAVPCKVVEAGDIETRWTAIEENVTRRDLSEQEIANQLKTIYELVRPTSEPPICPDCYDEVKGEAGLRSHRQQTECELPLDPEALATNTADEAVLDDEQFTTDRQALEYLAVRFLGRADDEATSLVAGHLRTAQLPPVVQALFKAPGDRSSEERTALENYDIDTAARLGSGEGRSGTSREVATLYETLEDELASDRLTPTSAVLETVGSLNFEAMSEQELRQTLREFRQDVTTTLDATNADEHAQVFRETLRTQAADLREMYEEVEPTRPFRKVDVLGPETQQYSRWHVRAMHERDETAHSALVKQLYQERLEMLAEEHGWS
jgi:Predicted transcriptional regulators